MAIITLANVSKIYKLSDDNTISALKNVSLQIKRGEFVAIIGPSGSGKSTLMHLIGILDKPTSGQVSIENSNVAKLSEESLATLRNKHIGFVFQAFNLLPKTSAVENVELPLVYAGVSGSERKRRATEALIKVGLGERLENTPAQLSGGQQQRVAIARALITKPSLILADEPTGNLDSKSGKEILELLKNLNKSGNTIVLVTHDKNVAAVANRVIEIKDGEILRDTKR